MNTAGKTFRVAACSVAAALVIPFALGGAVAVGATWRQQAKLTASDAAESDSFGHSVSISGGYAVVGAYANDDDDGDNSGSAYVFAHDGASWAQQAKLTADDAANSAEFGGAVAISGDYAVVGAVGNYEGANYAGAAYVFARSGANWTQQAKLTASDAAYHDRLGTSVAIDGATVIAGASHDDDGADRAGSAYVFVRDGASWTQQAKLTASDPGAMHYFGISLAISGETAIVGAYGDDHAGELTGSAYVFVRDGVNWTQQAKLTASDARHNDEFGLSVSISGDTAIVGCVFDDEGGSNAGAAYVYQRSGTTWGEQAKLTASEPANWDHFGYSVSISGELAVVGAYQNDDDGGNSGSVYVFARDGAGWTQQAKLTASDAAAGDNFGFAVSVSDQTAILGAPGNDDAGSESGSAYIHVPEPAMLSLLVVGGLVTIRRGRRA